MRVYVQADVCQGHTLCRMTAPQIFKLREEDGHSYVDKPEVPKEFEALALRAERGCPEGAIVVEQD